DQSLKQPIPYATVAIKSGDKVIKGGITNEDGSFELKQIKAGSYTVEVQFIGYQTYHKNIQITAQNPKHNLGTIGLIENLTQLEGVEVVAERSTIEQKIDRKVINVGKDLTTQGAS